MYNSIQITPTSWRIEEDGVRCFLFTGQNRALLVDTGYGGGDLLQEVRTLTDLPLTLVNTHADGDHIGCNRRFDAAYLHPSEYSHYRRTDTQTPLRPLWAGDTIDLGGRTFEVHLIPGHTPGSIALLDRDERILLCGDTVQDGRIFMFGPGRDVEAFQCSLARLASLLPLVDFIYPSHGTFPVPPAIVPQLQQGVQALLDGKLTPTAAKVRDIPIRVYDLGPAKLLMPAP